MLSRLGASWQDLRQGLCSLWDSETSQGVTREQQHPSADLVASHATSEVTPPQRTYRMAIMPIPPASHRWWLCDEWVNPRKEWAQRDHLDANHAQSESLRHQRDEDTEASHAIDGATT